MVICTVATLLSGCNATTSVMKPEGPAAARIANLWWLLLAAGGVIYLIVMGLLAYALLRRRTATSDPVTISPATNGLATSGPAAIDSVGMRSGTRMVLYGGVVATAVVLLTVFGFTVATLRALAMPDILERNTVHVVGHQWWWEVRYPTQRVVTANEIHIPAGEPVRVVLSSDDVIHSFWVPELHGKLDLVPGQTNEFWLQADQPGVYVGECAEFCGVQHAKMRFLVIAEPLPHFEQWIAAQQQPAAEPEEELARQGQQVFLDATCTHCHTVAGTHATGDLGPDLTHLASRFSLAAATLPNTRGNLAGWISDPQHNKPGALMPATDLTGNELQALLAYLATLQ